MKHFLGEEDLFVTLQIVSRETLIQSLPLPLCLNAICFTWNIVPSCDFFSNNANSFVSRGTNLMRSLSGGERTVCCCVHIKRRCLHLIVDWHWRPISVAVKRIGARKLRWRIRYLGGAKLYRGRAHELLCCRWVPLSLLVKCFLSNRHKISSSFLLNGGWFRWCGNERCVNFCC